MATVEEITSRFVALNARREAIDAERAPKCAPGARIGCCTYPADLIDGYVALNEAILGAPGDLKDAATQPTTAAASHSLSVLTDERVMCICEDVLYVIVYHLIETKQTDAMLGALVRNEAFFCVLPQAKTAKLVRSVLERLSQEVKDLDVLYKVFSIYRGWCESKKRTFLGLRLDLKIAILLLLRRNYSAALSTLDRLQQEVKALEDKPLLLDIYLVQAKACLLVRNVVRMKIALSNAKNIASNINTPTYVNAEIDLLSGLVCLSEKDYGTAYSYFFEAYEGFHMAVGGTHSVLFPNLARAKAKAKVLGELTTDTVAPALVSNAAVSLMVGEGELYSCHPTISDISPVFFTFYNLTEYKRGAEAGNTGSDLPAVDACGSHYLQYYGMLNLDLAAKGLDSAEQMHFESVEEPLDIGMLARIDERKLVQALKYLLLTVVITGRNDEMIPLLAAKNKQKFVNHVECKMIQRISTCYKNSSLVEFEKLLTEFKQVILMDPVLQQEIHRLYEALLERNITRILQPYSNVQIDFVANKLCLPQQKIEKKLAEMILDGKLRGTIDQGQANLVIYEEEEHETFYEDVNKTVGHMTTVIDTLYEKAQRAI
ncbi:26S proteasome regulatory protein subunit N6 [Babesia ovata]|uniref:26S proteasome regulatory protein subunit N6 n=1 Tax=Babesia ovata TaxID=189622 RepID=A0A2H6K6R4_9APIC|nr:26S proteasome regulatory protein subunit N6 [Babesia ovata]GBE58681.1 26S proteasome regulatory protein subunit N6 [Babesia ovata]